MTAKQECQEPRMRVLLVWFSGQLKRPKIFGKGSIFYHVQLTMNRGKLSGIYSKRASSLTRCSRRALASQLELLCIAPLPSQVIFF
jgi:hypothetical protein